jgi:SurA-like protein
MAATFHRLRIAALVIVAALMATGGAALGAISSLIPEGLPENTVAVVSHVGASMGRITKAEFHRALTQSAAQSGLDYTPKPGGNGYEKLKKSALGELLDTAWIEGQGLEMGIKLTSRQVSRELARLKRQAFKSEAAYRRFLRESHLTRRDVRERVRVQLISTGIQKRIVAGADGESEIQESFEKFISEYEERWRARTVCASGFTTDRCSNGPPPSARS